MADINTISLTGRLTKDVELKTFQNSSLLEFSLAVARDSKNPDGSWGVITSFLDCEYWTKANGLSSCLSKGRQIAVVGELRQEKWTDKQSGQARSKVVVHVNDLKLLAEPRGNAAPAQPQYANPVPQAPAQPQYANPVPQAPAQPQYANPAPQAPAQPQYARPVQNYRQPAQPAYNAPQGNFAPQTPNANYGAPTGGLEDDIIF